MARNTDPPTLSTVAGASVTLAEAGFDGFESAPDDERRLRQRLIDSADVDEALAIRTCQRIEVYAQGEHARDAVVDVLVDVESVDEAEVCHTLGEATVTHLFRVACGLESGVLGEGEILGQLRNSYHRASEAGALGSTLDTIGLKALRVGERARSETAIGEGAVSLGSVTVELAEERLGGLQDATVTVVGAGEVAGLVVAALDRRAPDLDRLVVANRTHSEAEELAGTADGEAVPMEALRATLEETDLLVSATGAAGTVIAPTDLEGTELLAIDLANPRDVDPVATSIPGIELLTLEDVLSTRIEGIEARREAIPAVERIVEEERERLKRQLRAERVDETLSEIYSRAHGTRTAELTEAISRLEALEEPLSETQESVIREFSVALVNKLLHPKTAALRQAAASDDRATVDAWLQLLDSKDGACGGSERSGSTRGRYHEQQG